MSKLCGVSRCCYQLSIQVRIVMHSCIVVVVIVDITILSVSFLTYDILGHYDSIVTLEILRCPKAHVVDSVEAQNDTSRPLLRHFILKEIQLFSKTKTWV